jgi:hypothetical protein
MSGFRFDTAAVVLGMHRSGTSALAGVLGLKGFAAPRNVLPSSAVNERGFWESERMNALNDELFAELGTNWHGLDGIRVESRSERWVQDARARTRTILSDEFDIGVRPLVKDPRLCRLLPLWQPAIAGSCRSAVYVITLRNPIDVAKSLAKRNDFDLELGYLLWARYYLDAEYHTRGLPRVVLTYDGLIANWRASLDAIAKAGVEVDRDSASDGEVDNYLSVELRHHRTADDQVIADLEHLPIVCDLYSALLEWVHGSPGCQPDPELLDRARKQFDDLGGMLSRIVENARLDRKRLGSIKSRADSIAAELERARRTDDELSDLRVAVHEQANTQSRIEERLEAVAISLSEAIQDRTRLEQLLADSRAEAKSERAGFERLLAKTTAEAEQQRLALNQALEEARNAAVKIEQLRRDAEAANEQLRRDALAAKEQHDQELSALSSERSDLRTELNQVKRKYRSTQHQLTRDREKLKGTQERLAQAESSLARIRASIVWRSYSVILAVSRRCEALLRRIFGSDRKLRAQRVHLIRTSPMFDGDWYRSRYADVAAAGIDPALHYLENGWKEGRDPSQSFSTTSYLRSNPDVARSGINPLLHFVEFGYSEGRHWSDLPTSHPRPATAPHEEFGPAAPCASFTIVDSAPVGWRRASRLADERGDLLTVDNQPVTIITSARQRERFEAAIRQLRALSGYAASEERKTGSDGTEEFRSSRLLDVWYVNDRRIRTRWRVDEPLVVRAYQCNPAKDGAVSMVGEGLALSEIDFVDLNLSSSYFPLMFVFARPDGTAHGFEFLAFPSLCRGGIHYPELLAIERAEHGSSEPIDIAGVSHALANQLEKMFDQDTTPFLSKIRVNLNGADGTEPIFQPDFQIWLSTVFQIAVDVLNADASGPTYEYLSGAVWKTQQGRDCGGALVVAADMVPAINILVMAAKAITAPEETKLPLLIADADPAQPVTFVELPSTSALVLQEDAPNRPPAWPRFEGASEMGAAECIAACAIRVPRRTMPGDSELLVPVAQPTLPLPEGSPPISWLIFAEDWDQESLAQGLQALSLQDAPVVAFVGDVQQSINALAHSLFNGRVGAFADVSAAVAGIKTPLIGYLGAQVILHDQRTSKILSSLLNDSAVVSASCVLVSAEKRGKGWHVSVADPGAFCGRNGEEHSLTDRCHHAQLFWWSTYPALRPPRDLWVARSTSVAGWLQRAGPLRAHEGLQLCTSLVTASYAGCRKEGEAHLRPPAAAVQQALRSEALFG